MRALIVNADDLGLSQGVNLGIMRAHQQGIVTSATVMVNMPAAREAFALAHATPTLGVGLHVNLTAGRPLSEDRSSLTGDTGLFRRLPDLLRYAEPSDLEREIDAQIRAFLASGLKPTHLDSHHHVHLEIPAVAAVVTEWAKRLQIPVRGLGSVHLCTGFYGKEATTADRLRQVLADLPECAAVELMTHPAYLDSGLQQRSSYAAERVQELATLTDPALRDWLAAQQFTLVHYGQLAQAAAGEEGGDGAEREALHG